MTTSITHPNPPTTPPPKKRFTLAAFFSAVFATLFLALAVTLAIVWTNAFEIAPNLPLTTLLAVPLFASIFAWSYFITGRKLHGWIVALLFAFFGIPMVVLGILETINPPQQHEMITLQVGFNVFGAICLIPVLLSALLIRGLRNSGGLLT